MFQFPCIWEKSGEDTAVPQVGRASWPASPLPLMPLYQGEDPPSLQEVPLSFLHDYPRYPATARGTLAFHVYSHPLGKSVVIMPGTLYDPIWHSPRLPRKASGLSDPLL